jgi:hypothetical protein
MNPHPEKQCPFCAEYIKAAAKVCPRCRQWLSMRSFRHPLVGTTMGLVLLMLTAAGFLGMMHRLVISPPNYTDSPAALQIIQSQMFFKDATNGPHIYITGILSNQSQTAWRDIEFECRFWGTNGDLTDAYNARCAMTILPNDDGAFRVAVIPIKDAGDYANMKLTVSNAKN